MQLFDPPILEEGFYKIIRITHVQLNAWEESYFSRLEEIAKQEGMKGGVIDLTNCLIDKYRVSQLCGFHSIV